MFRIGEFSRITKVTIDTLRHYDTLGLFKPAKVDPLTGYRYYSARQLQTLNRILALKESGFSLEEIARILEDKPTHEQSELFYGSPHGGDLTAEVQFPVVKA